jgi:hypothetical protein
MNHIRPDPLDIISVEVCLACQLSLQVAQRLSDFFIYIYRNENPHFCSRSRKGWPGP